MRPISTHLVIARLSSWPGLARPFAPCLVLSALALLLPLSAIAQTRDFGAQIYAHGNDNGVLPCAACHGANGQGNTSIGAPKLAGLPAPVIKTALAQIAANPGGNTAMRMVAQSLTPAATDAIAAYLANLK
jgi:cytochrome c553